MSDKPYTIQDDITIFLQAQEVIVHETVRVGVSISAQVDPTQSEAGFRDEIHSTLRKFIDSDWKIQAIQRSKGSKYENVYVTATARVAEKENHHLNERANELTRIGFELINPTVDYALTFDEVQSVNAKLRLDLLQQALAETTAINETFRKMGHGKPAYRISSTRFDAGNQQQLRNAPPIHAMMASATVASPMGGSFNAAPYQDEAVGAAIETSEPRDLNVSTRFTMTGTFVLRSVHHV